MVSPVLLVHFVEFIKLNCNFPQSCCEHALEFFDLLCEGHAHIVIHLVVFSFNHVDLFFEDLFYFLSHRLHPLGLASIEAHETQKIQIAVADRRRPSRN